MFEAHKTRREGGFTLIELGIAIAIAVILGIVALGVYASVRSRSDVYRASTNLHALAAAIRADYHGDYADLSMEELIAAGDVPKTMIAGGMAPNALVRGVGGASPSIAVVPPGGGGSSLHNVWGGDVSIGPAAMDNYHFTITYYGVKAKDCAKFVSGGGPAWDDVEVDNGSVDPSDHAAVVNACPTSGTTSLSWTGH